MIPNENRQARYRGAECGWFTLPDLPTAAPVIDRECQVCDNRTFVRDLTAAELIELYGLLRAWPLVAGLFGQKQPRPHPPADLAPLDCFEEGGK